MQARISTFVVAAAAAVALTATPAAAQGHGGGHGGGGHSGGGHSGGGHATAAPRTGGGHVVSGGGRATHRVAERAVPRTSHGDRQTVVPSHGGHLGGFGTFGLGLGVYAYPYRYGYSPYRYGYSPYGYGYSPYGYPGYYGGYPSGYYGGYVRDGHARLRILGAPRDAEVYVDGYYAGIVNDFDGVFQHLELDPGPHEIEIRAPGFAPIVFNVQAIGGRTITYRAQMAPYRP